MVQRLVPDFRRQVEAVNHVHRLLHQITTILDSEGVPYAVIGGNAVAAWVATVDDGAVRATKDVDLLIRREDLDRAKLAATKADFEYHEVLGVSMFLTRVNPNPKTGVHLIFANETIRENDSARAPDLSNAWRTEDGYLVIDLPSLLKMKLLAFRLRDQTHIRDMFELNLITPEMDMSLPDELRKRLEIIRNTP